MTLNVYSLKKFCTNVILIWCNNCACGVFCVSHSVNDADDVYRHQKNHTRHNTGVTVNGPFMHGGTFCPAGRMSADISTSKRWKKLRFYDFALTSIVYKMA